MPQDLKPIRLISETERLSHKIGLSTFFYRRIPNGVSDRLRKAHTNQGQLDAITYGDEILRYCLLDWDNVYGDSGPVKFSVDLIPLLPDGFKAELLDRIRDPWVDNIEKK